jgi:ADP-ribosyl-[dinitrogen reductase] hydrolase
MKQASSKDKALGAFVGLAIGDALGAPVEFKKRGSFPVVSEMLSGGYFRLPAGAWTDDTAMALCLSDALKHNSNIDARDLLERFCRWASDGENTSTGISVGIGQNTLRVLGEFKRHNYLNAQPTKQRADGNGAVMRLAPVSIRHWRNPKIASEVAIKQSQITHYSTISAASCELLSLMLVYLISGNDWKAAKEVAVEEVKLGEAKYLTTEAWKIRAESTISSTGFVLHTMEAAFWAVENSSSFEDCLVKAVNLGDDADSVGAVAGQLAGALYGVSAIPTRWLEKLYKRNEIESSAAYLFDVQ